MITARASQSKRISASRNGALARPASVFTFVSGCRYGRHPLNWEGCLGGIQGFEYVKKFAVMKCAAAMAAVTMLSACGGKTMIESDMSRIVAASPASPWLTLENKGDHVVSVSGLPASDRE